jgi:hypothetical protein
MKNPAFLLLLLLYLLPSGAGADDTERLKASKELLTGADHKTWVFTRVEMLLGQGKKCKQGEAWKFYTDGNLLIERCTNGEIKTESAKWKMSIKGPNDTELQIDYSDKEKRDQTFTLLFPQQRSKPNSTLELMVLRKLALDKIDPTVDLQFTYDNE